MSNNSPLVSVVVPCYNQELYIKRAIESIFSQTYRPLEIIFIDDTSTDNSVEIVKKFQNNQSNEISLKVIVNESNLGVSANKSKGMKLASADFITYLDGDDFFYPKKIEKEISVFIQNPKCDVVYSNFNFTDVNGNILDTWKQEKAHIGSIQESIITRNFPRGVTFRNELIKKNILDTINFFDSNLLAYEDWNAKIKYSKFSHILHSNYTGSAYSENPKGISKRISQKDLLKEEIKSFKKAIIFSENAELKKRIVKWSKTYFLKRKVSVIREYDFINIIIILTQYLLSSPKDFFLLLKKYRY